MEYCLLVLTHSKEMIPDLVKGTLILKGGYKVLDESEVAEIFNRSL